MRDGVTFCAISNVYKISWEVRFPSTKMDKAGSETKPSFNGPGADIAHRILFLPRKIVFFMFVQISRHNLLLKK